MTKFIYTVQDNAGATTSGSIDAADENEAVSTLQNRGLFILSLQAEKPKTGYLSKALGGSGRVGQRDLAFLAEQLATLLNGGVPLVRALTLLGEHSQSKALQTAISAVTKDVASGNSLHVAMGKHPQVFSSLWVSLVQAGEMGGQMPRSLKQVARYIQAQDELRARVFTALMYPAVLGFISIGVLITFVVSIVPTFAAIFKEFNLTLPPLTAFVVFVSLQLSHNMIVIALVLGGIAFIVRGYLGTESGQLTKAEVLFSLPFFGPFVKNIMIERMLTTLSALVESGVSILNAISVLEGVFATNLVFLRALKSVKNDVASGKSISAAFSKTGVFPTLVTEMMWMGEESGKLPDILSTLSSFYREQIDQFIRRFTAVIDPIMVVIVGGIVGVIVISIFLPIFKLSQIGTHGR